jgi:hypothetical protein
MMAGKPIAVPGGRNKMLVQSQRLVPRALTRTLTARYNQPDRRLITRRPSGS